jgi:signal transduction histidine kinase
VDLTAYRIVQEALTNTIRHSRAARAAVTLSYEPGYITVSVTESGRRPGRAAVGRAPLTDADGRELGPLLAGSGLGLAGIAERVASCGGNLTVGPNPTSPADGFAVTARLPSR